MPKTLVISDIHNRHKIAQQILDSNSYDKAIFLGDYFDMFHDTPKDALETAEWLKSVLYNPKHVFLIGNHDLAYKYPSNPNVRCSGFSPEKSIAIRKILSQNDFNQLKLFEIDHGILFSHAGVSVQFLNFLIKNGTILKQKFSLKRVSTILSRLDEEANKRYELVGWDYLCLASKASGGPLLSAGPLWERFMDFFPTSFPQIFGHTPHTELWFKFIEQGKFTDIYKNPSREEMKAETKTYLNSHKWALDLDTHNTHYLVINDDILELYHNEFDSHYSNPNRKITASNLIFSSTYAK